MGILSGIFKARDKPTNATAGSGYRFLFGSSTFGGSGNANKVAVLEEGMKYMPISISPEQAQF